MATGEASDTLSRLLRASVRQGRGRPRGVDHTEARTDVSGQSDKARAMLVQPDGKILVGGGFVGGAISIGNDTQFAVARYQPNGVLDTSFGW